MRKRKTGRLRINEHQIAGKLSISIVSERDSSGKLVGDHHLIRSDHAIVSSSLVWNRMDSATRGGRTCGEAESQWSRKTGDNVSRYGKSMLSEERWKYSICI